MAHDKGYKIIEPHMHTSKELISILASAENIIAESGSTSINAIVFGPKDSRITVLQPRRLFETPTKAMIYGGLPYILPYLDRLKIVLGETILSHQVQTSDVVYYDPAKVFE